VIRTVRAEWTKLRTLPSTAWLLLLMALCTVALGWAVTGTTSYHDCQAPCVVDGTRLGLFGVRLGQVGLVILGALAVTAEYGTRTIVPTLSAMPGRLRVLAGKLTVVTVLAVTTGAFAVLASLAVARPVLASGGFTASHGYAGPTLADALTRRAALGTVAYLGLVAMLSAGVGAVLRDTAATIATVLAMLYGAPIVGMFVSNPTWQHRIHKYAPMDAGLAIQSTRDLASQQIGPWAGLGVLAAYVAAAVGLGALLFRWRDA
jgi:ABC-2 type transport system permease protein